MHLFGPLLEQKKAPVGAARTDGRLQSAGAVPAAPIHFDQSLVGQVPARRSRRSAEIVDNVHRPASERDGETGHITRAAARGRQNGSPATSSSTPPASASASSSSELNAPWISYARELPVNRALPFWLPVSPRARRSPTTPAPGRSEAGWMWQIPTQSRYGCGYVYSDEFRTPERGASRRWSRRCGRKIEVRGDIHFKIGRLERRPGSTTAWPWGSRSSFLEPLESDLDPRLDRAADDVCGAATCEIPRR